MTDTIATADALPEFRVGTVISKTFSTFGDNFFKFFILSLLMFVPVVVFGTFTSFFFIDAADATTLPDPNSFIATIFGIMAVMMISIALVLSAITYGSIEYQAGKPVAFFGMLARAVKTLVPVVIASVLIALLYMLGAIFLIVPGIIAVLMFSMTVPAIVAEGLGPIDAMRRSRELTHGYKWPILGAFFTVVIIIQIVEMILTFGITAATASLSAEQIGIIFGGLVFVMGGVYYGFIGSCVATIYTELRAAKEGTSADKIAEVFA